MNVPLLNKENIHGLIDNVDNILLDCDGKVIRVLWLELDDKIVSLH